MLKNLQIGSLALVSAQEVAESMKNTPNPPKTALA